MVMPGIDDVLKKQSVSSMWSNFKQRKNHNLVYPRIATQTSRADIPYPFRYDWAGHDPATPMAEMQINYYQTAWPIVMFVAVQTLHMLIKA